MKIKSEVKFIDEKLGKTFQRLKNSRTEDKKLYDWLSRAFEDIEENAFCGIQIPKRLVPEKYIKKYKTKSIYKYNLPGAWRLIYAIIENKPFVISLILEWFPHKEYEKRFKYLL